MDSIINFLKLKTTARQTTKLKKIVSWRNTTLFDTKITKLSR